jgi:hypothetical protein
MASAEWTVLLYFVLDAGVDRDSVVQSLAGAEGDPAVKVLVEIIDATGAMTRSELLGGKLVEKAKSTVDPSRPGPLSEFIRWGLDLTADPPKRSMVVVSAHGNGVRDWSNKWNKTPPNERGGLVPPVGMANPDAIAFSKGKFLTTAQLGAEFQGLKVDVIGFDACLMSMVEVGYELALATGGSFLVASEVIVPSDGWPYKEILSSLATSPTTIPEALASTVVDKYKLAYAAKQPVDTAIASVDLAKLITFAEDFKTFVARDTLGFVDSIASVRQSLQDPIYVDGYYVDVGLFFEALAKAGIAGVPKVGALVTKAATSGASTTAGYTGVSLFYPPAAVILNHIDQYNALKFSKDTGWGALLLQLAVRSQQPASPTVGTPLVASSTST